MCVSNACIIIEMSEHWMHNDTGCAVSECIDYVAPPINVGVWSMVHGDAMAVL